jgi:hypothetical protein
MGLTDKLNRAMKQREELSLLDCESGSLLSLEDTPRAVTVPPPGNHRSNPLLTSLKNQLKAAESAWKSSLSEIHHLLLRNYDQLTMLGGNSPSAQLFYNLFTIFIDDDLRTKQRSLNKLNQIYRQSPDAIAFFIPQIIVFLLYGAFEMESSLKSSLLYMCAHNLTFAYKVEWYLMSFYKREQNPFLTEKTSGDDNDQELVCELIELIRQHGDLAAKQLWESSTAIDMTSTTTSYGSVSRRSETYPFYQTREMMWMPKHSDLVMSTNGQENVFRDLYKANGLFWMELISISRQIIQIDSMNRPAALKKLLSELCEKFLPSAVIHVPFHNTNNRIYGMHLDECFAFSTKDRAPLLICLEVVHFDGKKRYSLSLNITTVDYLSLLSTPAELMRKGRVGGIIAHNQNKIKFNTIHMIIKRHLDVTANRGDWTFRRIWRKTKRSMQEHLKR